MRYIDEYRDPQLVRSLARQIHETVTRPWVVMEICGGQTHTIMRYGLQNLLPPSFEIVHGPGCPVCVTPIESIDRAIAIAARPNVILASYGDMLRVPGSDSDLFAARAAGADVRIVYSPLEALRFARENPGREVVFFAVGFETTAPAHAAAIRMARRSGVGNFSMLVSHVLVPPAIRAILGDSENRVQAFIAPGHVCAVAGYRDYEELSREYHVPVVVAGFEPVDLMESMLMLARQLEGGRAITENQYVRSVQPGGNAPAQAVVREVFRIAGRKWRGIGSIPSSGLEFNPDYESFDAEARFDVRNVGGQEAPECISALILQGRKKPVDCPEFGRRCMPEAPLGAPMVSAEGACSAYYRYARNEVNIA